VALFHGQLKDYPRAIEHMTTYLQLVPDAANARAAKDEIYKWEFSLKDTLKSRPMGRKQP
jgi:regulator of sirC expression with transglutaminase-like and TPR domain